jgi:hypothetical protein
MPLLWFRSNLYCYSRPSINLIHRCAATFRTMFHYMPHAQLFLQPHLYYTEYLLCCILCRWSTVVLASGCSPRRTTPLATFVAVTAIWVWRHLYPWQIGCDSITLTQQPGNTEAMIYSRPPTVEPRPSTVACSIKRCQNDVKTIHSQRY